MKALIRYFASQGILAELITVTVLILGIGSMLIIKREAFPNISFDIISISTPFPGASSEEVERLLTNPLEQDLKELDGIKRLESISAEGLSYIIIWLDPDQTTEDEAKADVQEIVDRFTDRPDDAEDPIVKTIESKLEPVIIASLTADVDEMSLRTEAKKLEEIIESLPEVARVEFSGLRDIEIKVKADINKLNRYQITLNELVMAISEQNKNIPGGAVPNFIGGEKSKEIIVRTVGEFHTKEDVENTVVRANDLAQPIRVKDVAVVEQVLEKASIYHRTNGKSSISLTVLKKESADSILLVDKLKELVEREKGLLSDGVEVNFINDQSYYIRRRLKVLSSNMAIGLALVMIILSLILPMRVALVTSIGIPFAFLGTLMFFQMNGISLNLIIMMGLIIVTGMLVDDAVVVTENAVRHIEDGHEEPVEAAINATNEIWKPVTASVLTTVVAFAPLMFMSGIFGKFVRLIPMGVIAALLISLYECFFILPHHIGSFVKINKNSAKNKINQVWDDFFVPSYLKVLRQIIRLRYWVWAFSIVLFFSSVLVAVKVMRFNLFPPDGIEMVTINLETATGTQLEVTREYVKIVESKIAELPKEEVEDYATKVGLRSLGVNDPNVKRGGEYAQIVIYLTPENSRDRIAKEIIEDLRERIGKPKEFKDIAFLQAGGGPPVGKPVSLGVRGKEYNRIMVVVNELKEKIAKIEGVSDIQDSFAPGKEELHILVDPAEAAAANVSVGSVGTTARAVYSGLSASKIRKLDEEIDIKVTLPDEYRESLEALKQIKIPNARGNQVSLGSIASFKKAKGIAAYEHEGNERQVRITAEIDVDKNDSTSVNNQIRDMLPEYRKKYPEIDFNFGGEDQDTKESLATLKQAFFVALLGIAFILILIFQNLLQPLLVLGTIPLGIMSVIWTFFIHGKPMSFLGLMGIIALGGVVVNNAIVFVSFVNDLRAKGLGLTESILETGRVRLRPIMLTTLTTVAGILPTAYGWGGLDQFVVPIALALGWGVFFGALLTTLVFPAYLSILDDIQFKLFKRKKA